MLQRIDKERLPSSLAICVDWIIVLVVCLYLLIVQQTSGGAVGYWRTFVWYLLWCLYFRNTGTLLKSRIWIEGETKAWETILGWSKLSISLWYFGGEIYRRAASGETFFPSLLQITLTPTTSSYVKIYIHSILILYCPSPCTILLLNSIPSLILTTISGQTSFLLSVMEASTINFLLHLAFFRIPTWYTYMSVLLHTHSNSKKLQDIIHLIFSHTSLTWLGTHFRRYQLQTTGSQDREHHTQNSPRLPSKPCLPITEAMAAPWSKAPRRQETIPSWSRYQAAVLLKPQPRSRPHARELWQYGTMQTSY